MCTEHFFRIVEDDVIEFYCRKSTEIVRLKRINHLALKVKPEGNFHKIWERLKPLCITTNENFMEELDALRALYKMNGFTAIRTYYLNKGFIEITVLKTDVEIKQY